MKGSVHPFSHLYVHLSVRLYVRPPVLFFRLSCLSIRPFVHHFVQPSVNPSVRPSFHQSIRLSVRPSIRPFTNELMKWCNDAKNPFRQWTRRERCPIEHRGEFASVWMSERTSVPGKSPPRTWNPHPQGSELLHRFLRGTRIYFPTQTDRQKFYPVF